MGYGMIFRGMRVPLAALGLLAASATAGIGAEAPAIRAGDACPANVGSMAGAVGAVIGCWCADNAPDGSVWGSGPYTGDSNLCTAARHAGAMPTGGGAIWVRIGKGEASYSGSDANGVRTSSYGAFGSSLAFVTVKAAATACPANMQGQSGLVTCACPASQTGSGTVWGTDIYTEDSAVCRAAVHAGVIGPEGGTVSIITTAGQPEYTGSSRNGVQTSDYGPWGASYIFAN